MTETIACPHCGTRAKISESFTQATRKEPSRSLGESAYCPNCKVSYQLGKHVPANVPRQQAFEHKGNHKH